MDLLKLFDPNMMKDLTKGAEEFGKTIKAILGVLVSINKNLEGIKKLLQEQSDKVTIDDKS